ncbi:MAG: hypothetical protein IKV77_01080 [Alistipes sp.]|nr:hypothetical protein [Bacteroidaceae bacterium]MBQ8543507.1 hypothetical protein [Bacteroidaceae bacterium]MBR5491705.1 hypothetical protein [Alistipes sp.]
MKEEKIPSHIVMQVKDNVSCIVETVTDSATVFDEDFHGNAMPIPGTKDRYIPFGVDDQLPYEIIHHIGRDEIMSQNKFFNVLTCYASGLNYTEYATDKPTRNPEIRKFVMRNSLPSFFLEQCTDMKYFFFSVDVVIVSKDRKQIVQIRHKEACYCRFEEADKNGKINHIFYGDFRESTPNIDKLEKIRLLDFRDPLGELMVLMGREPGKDGKCEVRTNEYKFAIVSKFPTPGLQYYPVPYYTSIFRGHWYDIKQLIGIGKKAKLRNSSSIKYHVEVHKDYWEQICSAENIYDPEERKKRIAKEYENIKEFISGIDNHGKLWVSGFYQNPDGKEVSMVKINLIDSSKEGGDWTDDIQESSNTICYADNIHPNLVGATPGKSQTNNSGSDKRELFTLKQSLEKAPHDILCTVHNVVIAFNGWDDVVYPDIPLIMLTTLDQKNDAKKVSMNNNSEKDPNDE